LTNIIADSGSTKTDWIINTDNQQIKHKTKGINPLFMSTHDIVSIFKEISQKIDSTKTAKIFYYGAGCSNEERKDIISKAMLKTIPKGIISVEHDLIGAARATCHNKDGIVCILGTGSNACTYINQRIVSSIGGHGFILGDEGSGANIGLKLIQLYLEKQLAPEIVEDFHNSYQLNRDRIIESVYKEDTPNQFLAQFSHFVHKHQDLHYIAKASIESFIEKHLLSKNKDLPIHFVGSIATTYKEILIQILQKHNLKPGAIIQKPIDGLKKYHLE